MAVTEDFSFFHQGDRRGVLLIHGLTGTPTEMRYIGKGLADRGFTVSGMQLAGHCGTEADLLATNWHDWFASVQQAFDRLSEKCDQVFVAGLSMGALMSLRLAAANPGRVSGLALYSTTIWYDGWSIPRLQFLLPWLMLIPGFHKLYYFTEAPPYGIKDEKLRKIVVGKMFGGDSGAAGLPIMRGTSLRELQRLIKHIKRDVPQIETPALVVHASNDDVTSLRNARFLVDNLAGPTELVELDDSYHMITVDRQRRDVVDHSARFFDALSAPTPAKAVRHPVTAAAD